jgi:hypothetical protein
MNMSTPTREEVSMKTTLGAALAAMLLLSSAHAFAAD